MTSWRQKLSCRSFTLLLTYSSVADVCLAGSHTHIELNNVCSFSEISWLLGLKMWLMGVLKMSQNVNLFI